MLGVALFLASSYLQFSSHRILANLRRDSSGRIVTLEHSIPRGSLFELISCPHYFAEILIYLSLCLVFAGQSTTWWFVCCFVLINQVIVGLFNHHWYHKKFEDYPRRRKAVFPYLIWFQYAQFFSSSLSLSLSLSILSLYFLLSLSLFLSLLIKNKTNVGSNLVNQ